MIVWRRWRTYYICNYNYMLTILAGFLSQLCLLFTYAILWGGWVLNTCLISSICIRSVYWLYRGRIFFKRLYYWWCIMFFLSSTSIYLARVFFGLFYHLCYLWLLLICICIIWWWPVPYFYHRKCLLDHDCIRVFVILVIIIHFGLKLSRLYDIWYSATGLFQKLVCFQVLPDYW